MESVDFSHKEVIILNSVPYLQHLSADEFIAHTIIVENCQSISPQEFNEHKMPNLKTLKLIHLSGVFRCLGCPNLTSLEMRGMDLRDFEFNAFQQLTQLKLMECRSRRALQVENLSKLEALIVKSDSLLDFPLALPSSLKLLDFGGYQYGSINFKASNLSQLKEL